MTEDERIKIMMEEEHKIMEGYIGTAKTFTQLSIGALVLSITFLEKILGESGKVSIHFLLFVAWIFWLLAALAGAFYQYRAIKWLETLGEKYSIVKKEHHAGDRINIYPYRVYGLLLICFYGGTIFFALFGIIKILQR